MGSGYLRQKKQARQMQEQMSRLKQTISEKFELAEVEGASSQDLVKVTLSGTGELKRISINPSCVDPEDVEGLESLIKQAFVSAHKQVQELASNMEAYNPVNQLLGGLGG